jgi:diguanylate cyclase (GGDEF)-like protein
MWRLLRRLEPPLEGLEDQYRQHYLAADVRQALFFVLIVVLASLAFIPIDIGLLREQPLVMGLTLALRIGVILISAALVPLLRRVREPARYDRMLLAYSLVASAGQGLSALTRPANYYGTSTFEIVLVLYFYLLVPNVLPNRLLSAGLTSAFSLATLFFAREFSLLYWSSIPVALFGVHLVGFTSSIRANAYRRQEYRAIYEAKLLNERLTVLADTDSLTGAYNRRKFIELGSDEFLRFRRYGHQFSLLLADIDHFKRINDQHGHPAGDEVLRSVARVLHTSKRATDAVGRLGGEEFALLLPETSQAAARVVADRIREDLQAAAIPTAGGVLSVTFSAGVVEVTPDDAAFDDVLRRADQALYRAKERGRNRVEV